MNDFDDDTYQGEGPSLQAAFEDAWHKAKEHGGPPGKYTASKIAIEASNPIHSYIVIIKHGDD